jgi:WD40 repeat protein
MNIDRLFAAMLALPILISVARAQTPLPLPVLDEKPVPQIDAGGPSAAVTALAFTNDGETLFAASLDKVVRVWTMQKESLVLKTTYRVPIAPGPLGAIHAVALSPDGAWVAMAGRAPMRGWAGFRQNSVIIEATALSDQQNQDAGVIYVVNTANRAGSKVLRGHLGEVLALTFAPASKGKPPLLVSAAKERRGGRQFAGLRLWDVESGQALAARTDLPATADRPGLAIWHTGSGSTQIRVAVAWPEEDSQQTYFRLWDTEAGPLQGWQANRFTRTVALLGQEGGTSVLTGGLGPDNAGRLRVWQLSPDRQTLARFGAEVPFPSRGGVSLLPVSLTVVSAYGDAPSHAAVLLQPSANMDFRLALVDLRTNRVVADVPLRGSDRTRLPTITGRGGRLAVAATRDHAVHLYALADLLQGKTEPKAILASDGLLLRQVAFVDRGRGIWLSEDERARLLTGGLLFDFDKRQLRASDHAELVSDAPKPGDWSFSIDTDRKGVTLRHGETKLRPVRLPGKRNVVTAVALRPSAGALPGVLAVAYRELDANRVLIMLCDPTNGKPYRMLVSHLQEVRQLAFSASRPLLASVADDQTVCVWSLVDIDRGVGQISGLEVVDGEKKVIVRSVEPGGHAAKAGLAAGDVMETVGSPGEAAKRIQDAVDFVRAISWHRPGDQVAVTVAGKGLVKLPVDRGVDERKPLFSLFLVRAPSQLEWICWSPAGPYDCSGAAAEAHLGWHTNTGDPAAPVSYAAAREYRKDYYREGILRELVAEADLSRALKKWDTDHPIRTAAAALRFVSPDGALPLKRATEFLVRQAVKSLRVGINDDYLLDDKQVLRWRLTRSDGGHVKADAVQISGQATRTGKEWQVDLAGAEWKRGEYRLRAGLCAHADGPELASEIMTLLFQPPAPAIALRLGQKIVKTTEQMPLRVNVDRLALQIDLQAPVGQAVLMQFAHSRNGVPQQNVPKPLVLFGRALFQQEFGLQQGLNHITVQAINQGALAGHEAEESAAAEIWVSYKASHELPPRFTAVRLYPQPEPEIKRVSGKEVWVVRKPDVRLTAKVEAAGIIEQVDWSSADGVAHSVLPPQETHATEIVANLKLEAGKPTPVRLRAKSKRSDENVVEHWLIFYPPLPAIATDTLSAPDVFTEKIPLTGTFQAGTYDAFSLRLRVTSSEGKMKSFSPELDLKARKWKVELSLFPGSNTIEALTANQWRGEQAKGLLKLYYRRPPQITGYPRAVEAVETNKVKLGVTVQGPAGRPLTAFKVDGNAVPFQVGKPETQGDSWIWKVELPEVFVNDGDRNLHQVSLQAFTDEGESPAALVRVVHKRIPQLPRAIFLTPQGHDTAGRPNDYLVIFRVESENPLERVELRRSGELLYLADLKKVERQGKLYVLQDQTLLGLKGGANVLELVAVNSHGRSPRAEVIVSYAEPSVVVSIDGVELVSETGDAQTVLRPVYRLNGEPVFPDAPSSLVWIVGRVRWSNPRAKELDDLQMEVVAIIGEHRQFPAKLELRGKGQEDNVRHFRLPLLLIGSENRIQLEVQRVGRGELVRSEFELACPAAAKGQRLHVLIVAVNVQDSDGLKNHVLEALAVDPKDRPAGADGPFYKKPPFEWCRLYRVVAGEVERGKVEAHLVQISNEIKRLKRETGSLDDIVLIYYRGEVVTLAEDEPQLPVPQSAHRQVRHSLPRPTACAGQSIAPNLRSESGQRY